MTASSRSARIFRMESRVAKQAEHDLIEAMKRMTPEQRLEAFIRHCRLMAELHLAGERHRALQSKKDS